MQETKTLTVPVTKKEVLIKGYVSGLADQQHQQILSGANKTSFEAPVDQISDPDNIDSASFPPGTKVLLEQDPTAQLRADNKLVELMLLSVDGYNGAGLLDKLLDLPKADVDYVVAEVKKLQSEGQLDPKAGATPS